jgi:hypothetical protein
LGIEDVTDVTDDVVVVTVKRCYSSMYSFMLRDIEIEAGTRAN